VYFDRVEKSLEGAPAGYSLGYTPEQAEIEKLT
jgi:hypothetical protein